MSKKVNKKVSFFPQIEKSKIIPSVSALNSSQKNALKNIANLDNHIIMLSGCAGTGKTHLAVAWGLEQMLKGHYKRMILTRPYVEAGEKIGWIPGSVEDKFSYFLFPIMDIIGEYVSYLDLKNLMEEKKIIILPVGFARGETFKDAFVILDEGQNTTITQMNLFLTRIGKNSKIVITGDPSQSDLGKTNGFNDALERLQGIDGLSIVHLDESSIVRHPIIKQISQRYSNK